MVNRKLKGAVATLLATLAVATTMAAPASPQPIVTGGLVNVTITDVLNDLTITLEDINVGVGLNLAANVCGVTVGVLVGDLRDTGNATCSTATQAIELTQQ